MPVAWIISAIDANDDTCVHLVSLWVMMNNVPKKISDVIRVVNWVRV